MGWVKDNVIDPLTGKSGAEAAGQAAQLQREAGQEAMQFQREALEAVRADLQPFREAGVDALGQLGASVFDPTTIQADPLQAQQIQPMQDVTQDPTFKALADEAQRRVFSNQAARGKLGSGGTAAALQDRLVAMGDQLRTSDLNRQLASRGQFAGEQAQQFGQTLQAGLLPAQQQQQQFNQLFDLARLSQSAAAQQAAQQGATGSALSNLATQIGNVNAAGLTGAAASRQGAIGGILQTVGQIAGGKI